MIAAGENWWLTSPCAFASHVAQLRNGSEIEKCRRSGREFRCWVKDVDMFTSTAIQAGVMRRFLSPSLIMGMFERIANAFMAGDGSSQLDEVLLSLLR